METGHVLAILLTMFAHFAGIAALLVFAGGDIMDIFKSKPSGPDDEQDFYDEPEPEPTPPATGLPLPPDAAQSPVRLREPGRIAEHYKRRPRRPEHAPAPERVSGPTSDVS